jgi:hypothetical protein
MNLKSDSLTSTALKTAWTGIVRSLPILCLLVISLPLNTHAASGPTNGLVAYYPFNGNANDESGNGNHGTVVGATLTTDRFGVNNKAYSFNGSNSRIDIPETLFGPTAAEVTISAWITTDNGSYAGDQKILYKGSANGEFDFGVRTNSLYFGPNLVTTSWTYTTSPLPTNTTVHVCGVYVRGQRLELWVNGVLVSSNQPPDELMWQNAGFLTSIGSYRHLGGTASHFRGKIDDLRVYNRALSASEVGQLHAIESALPPGWETTGLVAYYPFTGNANDESGFGNHGTPFSAMLATDRFGALNKCYEFNGTSAYIQVPDHTSLDIESAITVSAWIKGRSFVDQLIGGHQVVIVSKRENDGWGSSYQSEIYYTGEPLIDWTVNGTNGHVLAPAIMTNRWYQVLFTYDGTTVRVFVDGVETINAPLNGLLGVNDIPLVIGRRAQEGSRKHFFNGWIDDVRIYNRALSASQVAQLHAIESAPVINLRKAIYLDTSSLLPGASYQVQYSADLSNWTNSGGTFVATNTYWRSTNYWDVDDWAKLFFRLQRQ